jgi:hypothetical protein
MLVDLVTGEEIAPPQDRFPASGLAADGDLVFFPTGRRMQAIATFDGAVWMPTVTYYQPAGGSEPADPITDWPGAPRFWALGAPGLLSSGLEFQFAGESALRIGSRIAVLVEDAGAGWIVGLMVTAKP